MKTKVLKLTAKRINVRLKLSEARDLIDGLENGFTIGTSETGSKLADLLKARIDKEEAE
jgi:hypothetical protein